MWQKFPTKDTGYLHKQPNEDPAMYSTKQQKPRPMFQQQEEYQSKREDYFLIQIESA